MKEEFELFKNAYKTYNLDIRHDISKKVLEYIRERLVANKDFLEQLILITKEDITFEKVLDVFDFFAKKEDIYKKERNMKLNEFGFVSNIYSTSVGIIAVETSNTLKVLEYFILAIKSRNTIVISDMEFTEESLKSAFLIIFSEALKKFNIDSNIISIYPYEECNYELFDKIILEDDNQIREVRKSSDEIFIYIENEFFNEEVQREVDYLKEAGKNPIVIKNDFEDTIKKINKTKAYASCIYTKNPKLGYDFINLVKTDNAFVNCSISSFGENIKKHKNPLYSNKKIMFELSKISKEDYEENKKSANELGLTTIETTTWYKKIFKKILDFKKRLFGETMK